MLSSNRSLLWNCKLRSLPCPGRLHPAGEPGIEALRSNLWMVFGCLKCCTFCISWFSLNVLWNVRLSCYFCTKRAEPCEEQALCASKKRVQYGKIDWNILLLTMVEALLTSKSKITLASIGEYCSHMSDNCSKSHTANIRGKEAGIWFLIRAQGFHLIFNFGWWRSGKAK